MMRSIGDFAMFRCLILSLFLLMPLASHAAIISQDRSFDILGDFTLGQTNLADTSFTFFRQFDSSLGSLSQVDIAIEGSISLSTTLPIVQTCSFGCTFIQHQLILDIIPGFGLWDAGSGATRPRITYDGQVTGIPGVYSTSIDYSHSMSIGALSELLGFVTISSDATATGVIEVVPANVIPPLTSNLERSDFEIPFANFPLVILFPELQINAFGVLAGTVSSSGSINLTYTFDEPSPIPIPAAVWLFGTALVGLVGFSKRRKIA